MYIELINVDIAHGCDSASPPFTSPAPDDLFILKNGKRLKKYKIIKELSLE